MSGGRSYGGGSPIGCEPFCPKALDVLARALDDDAKVARDAAVQVLKACGMYGLEQPAGATRAGDFRDCRARAGSGTPSPADVRRRVAGAPLTVPVD
jgi:hypothetical protein